MRLPRLAARDGARCRRRDPRDRLAGRRGAADGVRDAVPVRGVVDGHHPRQPQPERSPIDWNRPDDVGDPVVAAAAGVVTTAVPNGTHGYGRYVVVDHGNGESTLYAHLQTVNVGVGQTVDQGSLLGLLGDTGNATGPHLHFEERLNGKDRGALLPRREVRLRQRRSSRRTAPTSRSPATSSATASPSWPSSTGPPPPSRSASRRGRSSSSSAWAPTSRSWATGTATAWSTSAYAARPSAPFYLEHARRAPCRVVMGNRSDIPVAGDWDGNGTWDIGVRKASSNVFRLRKPDGKSIPVRLGKAGDIPVTGDWNGDGVTDLGVYDLTKARFTLRIKDANGLVWLTRVVYGTPGRPAGDRRLGRQRAHRPGRVAARRRPSSSSGSPPRRRPRRPSRSRRAYGTARRLGAALEQAQPRRVPAYGVAVGREHERHLVVGPRSATPSPRGRRRGRAAPRGCRPR